MFSSVLQCLWIYDIPTKCTRLECFVKTAEFSYPLGCPESDLESGHIAFKSMSLKTLFLAILRLLLLWTSQTDFLLSRAFLHSFWNSTSFHGFLVERFWFVFVRVCVCVCVRLHVDKYCKFLHTEKKERHTMSITLPCPLLWSLMLF